MDRLQFFSFLFYWTAAVTFYERNVEAGPMKQSSRMAREIYPEIDSEYEANQAQVCILGDVVYAPEEPISSEQPCLKCKCQPPGVQCETIRCQKKPGCKAIHKPNKCCPDYQCECEHNGKNYTNGERLETVPGGECKVCYCRGGEVKCAEVSCYRRPDCEEKTVPGQCCPKYDNCPPKNSPETTINTPLVNVNLQVEETSSQPELPKIFDIQINSKDAFDNPNENRILDSTQDIEQTTTKTNKLSKISSTNEKLPSPKITIHEIIPEIPREIPITGSPTINKDIVIVENLPSGPKESEINDLVISDTETDSSEISEVFQQPPSVLRVGDKLLFINKEEQSEENNKNKSQPSVITVVGAEGLQRGEDGEEVQEIQVGGKNLYTEQTNDLELKTSESSHILSLVRRKKNELSTTQPPEETNATISTTRGDDKNYSEEPLTTETIAENTTLVNSENVTQHTENQQDTTEPITQLTLIGSSTEQNGDIDQNPAYPPIPDFMASPSADDLEINNSTLPTTTKLEDNSKILPEVLNIRSNKTVPQNSSNSEWLKTSDSFFNESIDGDFTNNNTGLHQNTSDYNKTESTSTENFQIEQVESTTIKEEPLNTSNSSKLGGDRPVESSEDELSDSGEVTTPKNNHESVITATENASVESLKNITSETSDMMELESDLNENVSGENVTEKNGFQIDNVNLDTNETEKNLHKDVEIINVTTTPTHDKHEKIISKRHSMEEDESDIVFRELDAELHPEKYERNISKEEEEKESKDIFKELLEETSTPKSMAKPISNNKEENEMIQRVTNALANLTLKNKNGGALDTSILGVISDFFRSQKDKYDSK